MKEIKWPEIEISKTWMHSNPQARVARQMMTGRGRGCKFVDVMWIVVGVFQRVIAKLPR